MARRVRGVLLAAQAFAGEHLEAARFRLRAKLARQSQIDFKIAKDSSLAQHLHVPSACSTNKQRLHYFAMRKYYRHGLPRLVLAVLLLSFGINATAAEISVTSLNVKTGEASVSILGSISNGDFNRLVFIFYLIRAKHRNSRIAIVSLESSGGSVVEAAKLAGFLNGQHVLVTVGSGRTCASACFLIFAAGSKKLVHKTSVLEVHRASIPGIGESVASIGVTVGLVNLLVNLHVSSVVIEKLVSTPPAEAYRLSSSDLKLMNVTVVK